MFLPLTYDPPIPIHIEPPVLYIAVSERVVREKQRPLFTDFAPRLLVSHPAEVKVAHAPLVNLLAELMEAETPEDVAE